MGWLDWLNVAGSVVDIASQIAGSLGDEDETEASSSSYLLGDLAWNSVNGRIYATNTDPANEVGLVYLNQNLSGATQSTLSTTVMIPANNGFSDETEDMASFLGGGTLTMNGIPAADANTPGQVFSFVMRSFSTATAISIIGGVQVSFANTSSGWNFTLGSTGPNLSSFKARIVDPAGNGASVQGTFAQANARVGEDSVTLPLPPGLDLSGLVKSMEVELTVDSSQMRRFFEKGRRGRPASEMPEELRARLQLA